MGQKPHERRAGNQGTEERISSLFELAPEPGDGAHAGLKNPQLGRFRFDV